MYVYIYIYLLFCSGSFVFICLFDPPVGMGVYATKTRMMIKDTATFARQTTKFMKEAEHTKPEIKEACAGLIQIICKRLKLEEEKGINI